MKQVTIREAKTHLSKLIQLALDGEEAVITEGKQPIVKLVVVPEMRRQRRLGDATDVIKYIADDFDAPLDDFVDYGQSKEIIIHRFRRLHRFSI